MMFGKHRVFGVAIPTIGDMFCPNKIKNETLAQLRLENLECQRHIRHYKELYSYECEQNKNLTKALNKFRNLITDLEQKIDILKNMLKSSNGEQSSKRNRSVKIWPKITSERTKHCKIKYLKHVLLETLKLYAYLSQSRNFCLAGK